MASFGAGPGTGGISIDPVRDFIKRQQQEREAQQVQQAKDELAQWLNQDPDFDLNPTPSQPETPQPSQPEGYQPDPQPTSPPSASVPLADDASISQILDQSTAKNLLAFLPTILFWFAIALSALVLSKTLHFALPYAFALTAKLLSLAVWSTSKALSWSSRAVIGLLWLTAWLAKAASWLLLLAWPVVAWVGGCFLLPRGSGLRRLSLLVPPPVWFVLVFLRARWWMTWPVAGVGLVRGGVALAHGPTRREAVALARSGAVNGWGWVTEGGIQRQWQQVLYGWDSANPDRPADTAAPSDEPAVAARATPTQVAPAPAPPTKPVPVPSSPSSSPKRRKKSSVG